MPCGKKPLVRLWDKPKDLRHIKPSRYEKNEASVKVHWNNVLRELEMYYMDTKGDAAMKSLCQIFHSFIGVLETILHKEDAKASFLAEFWDNNSSTVRDLVGPVIFERLTKIFNIPLRETPYVQKSVSSCNIHSEDFYVTTGSQEGIRVSSANLGLIRSVPSEGEEDVFEEIEEESSYTSTTTTNASTKSRSGFAQQSRKNVMYSKSSVNLSKANVISRAFSKMMSRTFNKSYKSTISKMSKLSTEYRSSTIAAVEDDLVVHGRSTKRKSRKPTSVKKLGSTVYNPHFDMLYCSESVTDMIKWNSRLYERRTFDLEASDEYSKRAELLTKQIAYNFYDWWTSVGSADYKSEIKRPKDIEDLFQVWFDEQASRGLVLDPKILPCVLKSIAEYVSIPEASCSAALKRQIAWDIWAETEPARVRAFNTTLPPNLRHIPPKNNTSENWHPVRIPEDLKSMEFVWRDVAHLTSTKAFHKWLQQRPQLKMPPYLKSLEDVRDTGAKKRLVVPSDFLLHRDSEIDRSHEDMNIPVSQLNLEIKHVISKLLND